MALELSAESKQKISRLLERYPNKQAALLPVLHVVQDQVGWLPDEAIELVAATLEVPASHVFGVVTFYTMFHRHPVGTNELMVCTNVACMLRGGYDILHHIEKRLGVKAGERTPDGAFTVIEEECLAACANAPMMICGDDYFLDLDEKKVDDILLQLRKRWEDRKKASGGGDGSKAGAAGQKTMLGFGPTPTADAAPAANTGPASGGKA